jgi:hypothetical protein
MYTTVKVAGNVHGEVVSATGCPVPGSRLFINWDDARIFCFSFCIALNMGVKDTYPTYVECRNMTRC